MNSVEFANDLTQKFQSFCLSGKNPFGITEYTQAAATIGDARNELQTNCKSKRLDPTPVDTSWLCCGAVHRTTTKFDGCSIR